MVRQRQRLALLLLPLLAACEGAREGRESTDDWFDNGEDLAVGEFVAFTDVNYDIADGDGILGLKQALFPVASGSVGHDRLVFGPGDAAADAGGCDIQSNSALPYVIEGVVTTHPRFYFKSSGCEWDSEEKYYGSFFIQDATGGQMILGDSKVARFDMGDRVRILARAVKTSFELDMVYSYDLLEITGRDEPIFYEETTQEFGCERDEPINWDACDTGRVKRITGTVVQEKDTFGDFIIENDAGVQWHIGLDVEMNRRGINYPLGTRMTATGPVLYSFSTYALVVMKKGQIQIHEDE